ncbi:MAG TPA: hypothetical protein PKC50_06580, partial [Elusimicrobiota bacterium]|nr:hypothetical protein [Elusimicrobiota bacterium]
MLSMKGQGRDAATLARLKRILKNALENEQFTGRFNQAEIDKGLGTVVPGSQAGFAQVSLLTLLASGLGAVVLALTGAPGVLVGFALVPGLLAAGMEAVRWWATGRGTPGRKPIAATPEREILEAAGVRRALTTPKVSVSPEMDKRQLQGGYKQDGTGVPVGAADDGSRARGENAGNQGYYAQGGRESFLKVYRDMRNFFENRAARHGGNPVRLVIKPGIGGQHTPFQGLASVFEVVDPSSGKIVGEYELGKNFSASLEAAVKDLRIGWDQVAVIPSSKSGSTDETMMIFVELLSVLIEKQSSKAFADLFLKTLHDLNFPDGANERPGKDLFKVDVKEDGFATTSLVELLSHRASQAGLDVNVRDVLGKVLGNMFFETTDRPEQSRLSAFIRNSGLDRDLGADAPGFGAMFDNVGGRWTADLHMLTFLAYHRLDAEAYWTARDAGIAEVVAGTHKAVEIGNTIVDLGIAGIALVGPNDLYWYAKSIEQNFNESLWPADAVNERRTPNLVAVRASDWEAQRANYEGRSDVMIIDAVTKDVPPIPEENQIHLGAVLNRAAGRSALPGMFAQLATTFYGITETVGDRLIARALLRAGYTANDVEMNNLDNPATKIVVDHLYLRQPYVELGKGLLEARLKGIQKEEASNP